MKKRILLIIMSAMLSIAGIGFAVANATGSPFTNAWVLDEGGSTTVYVLAADTHLDELPSPEEFGSVFSIDGGGTALTATLQSEPIDYDGETYEDQIVLVVFADPVTPGSTLLFQGGDGLEVAYYSGEDESIFTPTQDDNGNWMLDNFSDYYENFFYRTMESDSEMQYGYGYGYNLGVSPHEYSFGYGYGYSYGVLAYAYHDGWEEGDSRLGYFIAVNDLTGGGGTEFMLPIVVGEDGEVTVTVPFAMTLAADGLAGVVIKIPAGLVMTDASGLWDGSISITGNEDVPEDLADVLSSAVTISVDTGGYIITLSVPMIIEIPYAGFDGVDNGTVAVVDASGEPATISECTDSEYTGDFDDLDELVDSDNYTLGEGGDCYIYYDEGYVIVATRHLTDFSAGEGVEEEDEDDHGGGGGGLTFKKKVAVEETPAGEEEISTLVSQYTDLSGLKTDDWRYAAVKAAVDAGLFSGEMKNGKKVFNMMNTMNRAQAAQVVATYFGCPAATLAEAPFKDVAKDVWYANAVSCLKTNNIVGGKTALLFAPGDTVTRAEFFRMLVEAYLAKNLTLKAEWEGLMKTATDAFVDVKASVWYAPYMRLAYSKGLLSGYEIGGKQYVKGDNGIIRVEGAAMVMRFLGLK